MKKRAVYLITNNPFKVAEHRKNFERYGIEVIPVPIPEESSEIEFLLKKEMANTTILAALREESNLYKHASDEVSSRQDAQRVDNVTRLQVYRLQDGKIEEKLYSHTTEGYIDLQRKSKDPSVFGWDDIFVVRNTQKTYFELQQSGFKVSSRDMVISSYLRDYIYYKLPIDLTFTPQEQERTIEFDNRVADLIEENPYLHTSWAKQYKINNLLTQVSNNGVFFRSAKNRREKNYWFPGLNAGIPFTPKVDPIHEITYMVHDFGHFLIPDLIFTGNDSEKHRQVYITYRMMSEAVTLVLADMLFVDSLYQSGEKYDYAKRKIHPLFQATGLRFTEQASFAESLEKLLCANVAYCLRGDDSKYKTLLGEQGASLDTLEIFKEKYAPFFVEDFRWTERNYQSMVTRASEFQRWWKAVEPLRNKGDIRIETIDEFITKIEDQKGDVVERVFREVFSTRVAPILGDSVVEIPPAQQLQQAFFRYMMGQLGVFARFDFLSESAVYQDKIKRFLLDNRDILDSQKIDNVRGLYGQFIDVLREKNLISLDDALTFQEIYPLFEPFYVFYDEDKESYEDLSSISQRIVGKSGHITNI